MPVDLYDLVNRNQRTVTVQIGPEPTDTITAVYQPDKYTVEAEAALTAANRAGEFVKGAAEFLASILVRWDLTAGGEPFPVTPENINAIGFPIAKKIVDGLNADFVDVTAKKG